MKIYTKRGDRGETDLFGAGRVGKDDARVDAYGTVDECNAALGLARSHLSGEADVAAILDRVQGELFCVGSELAAPGSADQLRLIDPSHVTALEHEIDAAEIELTPLQSFVLPSGTPAAAALHLARTVARRAERLVVALGRMQALRPELVIYLNRLSDHLFVMARLVNKRAGRQETAWLGRKS